MSTRLSLDMDEALDSEGAHEHLALLFNFLVAHELEEALQGTDLSDGQIKAIRDSFTFDLAMLSDQGQIVVNGQTYRPRIAFVDENDKILPGAEKFDFMHEYAIIDDEDMKELKFGSALE